MAVDEVIHRRKRERKTGNATEGQTDMPERKSEKVTRDTGSKYRVAKAEGEDNFKGKTKLNNIKYRQEPKWCWG